MSHLLYTRVERRCRNRMQYTAPPSWSPQSFPSTTASMLAFHNLNYLTLTPTLLQPRPLCLSPTSCPSSGPDTRTRPYPTAQLRGDGCGRKPNPTQPDQSPTQRALPNPRRRASPLPHPPGPCAAVCPARQGRHQVQASHLRGGVRRREHRVPEARQRQGNEPASTSMQHISTLDHTAHVHTQCDRCAYAGLVSMQCRSTAHT